jgi:3-oxoacyl-[acyl-carrier-protein] synthase II
VSSRETSDSRHVLDDYFDRQHEFLSQQEHVMRAYLTRGEIPPGKPEARDRAPVWITGVGMVTPLGIGWQENWERLCRGESGVHAARNFDATGLASRFAGEVPGDFSDRYRAACRLPYPERYARFTQFALLSARQALDDAGIDLGQERSDRVGVCLGVGAGAFNYLLPVNEALKNKGEGIWPALDHNYVVKHMTNAAAAQLSIWIGAQGPSTTVSAACATGAQAIATAMDWIRDGRADVVLAGGCDSTVNRFVIHAYNQILALSTHNEEPEKASRPFDRRRDGFVMGEGGAVLVLESEEHARRRRASRHATLLGYGMTSEAYNIVTPRPAGAGMAKTMALALQDARIDAGLVDYISAHGTSTRLNDAAETTAIKSVFGERAYRIPVSSQKSMLGHAIGASSAIEAGVTALSMRHGAMTPTINYEEPDPECDLDYVPNVARAAPIRYALSNAFGFGGHNCCLVFGR